MNRTIIVTDLTRFKRLDEVCIAGMDRNNGECLRPMPYLETAKCQNLNILPGAILKGNFTASLNREGPHQEDYEFSNMEFLGPCTSTEFKNVLENGMFESVEKGFEITLQENQKHIPVSHPVTRSIITISTSPANIEIVEDFYKPGKIKLNFTDQSGRDFKYIPITDLGFHDYAIQHHQSNDLNSLNSFIRAQSEVLLRLGLSRSYKAPNGREGYWLQANGIYTFPDYHQEIRSYA